MSKPTEEERQQILARDCAWVQQILAGDPGAFANIMEAYQQAVYNLAYRMLGERTAAEDAAQEAFLRAYRNLHRYDQKRSFKTWLLSITSNYCIDRLRRRRLTWLSIDEPLPPHPALSTNPEAGPEAATLHSEREAAMQALLDELSPDYRLAVVLHYWYDYSYAEIAEVTGSTESAIKSRLFRARRALAEKIKAQPAGHLAPVAALEG